jgi:chemotaxis protein methyltransferase CheR
MLGPEKAYLLETRLAPLLDREKLADLDALSAVLQAGASVLAREVVEAMTTNETSFFRDGWPFEHVRTRALPALNAVRPPGRPVRIWSAAASTGQEAYSLAMIGAEAPGGRRIEILGTDIAREPLARAREGLYTQFEVQRGLPVQKLVRHFRRDGLSWRISEALRSMVVFREWNVLADLRPLGEFDIVFCRNVLIYFDRPTRMRVLDAIAGQLAPDGRLYLGGTETLIGLSDRWTKAGEPGVYAYRGLTPGRAPRELQNEQIPVPVG